MTGRHCTGKKGPWRGHKIKEECNAILAVIGNRRRGNPVSAAPISTKNCWIASLRSQ